MTPTTLLFCFSAWLCASAQAASPTAPSAQPPARGQPAARTLALASATEAAGAGVGTTATQAGGNGWQAVKNDDGIQVWRRATDDPRLFAFRGQATVEANILQVVAVVFEGSRHTEWSKNCVASFELERLSLSHSIIYRRNATQAPFVNDRDMVLDATLSLDASQKTVTDAFYKAHDERKAPPKGVVRVGNLSGSFVMKQIDATHTQVTYEVQIDPAGALPKWLVKSATQDLPFSTLQGLRLQVEKSGYEDAVRRVRDALNWQGFDLPSDNTELTNDSTAPTTPVQPE